MHRRYLLVTVLVVVALIATALPAQPGRAQGKKITLAFVPGVVDPFYQTMEVGVNQAVADFNQSSDVKIEVVTQIPKTWNVTEQTPIINAIATRKDISALITAAVDKEQMIPVLEAVDKAGIPVISVDTFIGDGDYENGKVQFPLSYIGSDNEQGGFLACNALAEAIGKKGKVYIQNVTAGISTTDQRQQGCEKALKQYPDITLVGVEFCGDDQSKATAQTTAVLQREKDLAGIFGTNVFTAGGAGTAVANAGLKGAVQVVAFDATAQAIEFLKNGTVTMVIAQKPYDMGYTAVGYALAHLSGVTSLPKRVPTGYAIITPKNMTDPEISRFFYSAEVGKPADPIKDFQLAFVPGVVDPFYHTMEIGVNDAAKMLGAKLVTQIPKTWNVTEQTPIINAIAARKDISALITAAVDKEQMIPVLEAVDKAGIPVISVDTFIGDGDYENGKVQFPLSYIGSNNEQGGEIACNALAEAIGKKGKVYIQNVTAGISTTDQRQQGCEKALKNYPDITLVGVEFCGDDQSKATAQTTAVLQREKDLAGIFGTNVFTAGGAGTAVVNAGLKGAVQVVAFDATAQAIEFLKNGTVTMVIAQKPYDMGFLAVFYAQANARGVTSIPKRIPTGYAIIDSKNMADPNITRFFYQ